MGFQTTANTTSPIGTEGAKASSNVMTSLVAPAGGLVADPTNGLTVARFAWIDATGKLLSSFAPGAVPVVPDGFVANEQQGLITAWLGERSMLVPPGLMANAFDRGDFYARVGFQNAARGNKVFANVFSGAVIPGAAGSFPNFPAGAAAAFTASFATTKMTVTAIASGTIGVGHLVAAPGIPANTRVLAQDSGTAGGAGVYSLSTTPGTVASGPCTSAPADTVGGATITASFATSKMTVTAVTDGVLVPGQLLKADTAGLAAGTYIVAQDSGTPGGAGVYSLSTTPGTIASGAVNASAWIETSWVFKTAANAGELAVIGRN